MKKIKSFKLFNGVESRLFESVDDTNEIISNVKDMLLELDFLDIDKSCELLPRVCGMMVVCLMLLILNYQKWLLK